MPVDMGNVSLFQPNVNAEKITVFKLQSDIRERRVSILLHRYHDIRGK